VQRALPARVGEEVKRHVRDPCHVVADTGFVVLMLGRYEGPVVEQRPAHDVLAWNKTPVARIEAVVAIVAHHEELAGWDDEVAIHDMIREVVGPSVRSAGIRVAVSYRRNGRKFVQKGSEIRLGSGLSVRIWVFLAIDVNDAIVKMNMVAGHSDKPLYQKEDCRLAITVDGAGLDKHDDVAALWLAIVDEGHPLGGRRQSDAVHNEVITDQERLLHRAGRNDEVLREKGKDKKAYDQNRANARRSFEGSLFVSFFCNGLIFGGCFGWRRVLCGHPVAL